MWFFRSPEIVFGEGALEYMAELCGARALVVTDRNLVALGLVELVRAQLDAAGIESKVYPEVEPNPSLQTVRRGAEAAKAYEPDWIVGLGGGSCIDAAKAIWILYERPDLRIDAIAPVGALGLRHKARLLAIPTTSGTGAETTWPIVLTDLEEERKLSVGHPECIPDVAIVDPALVSALPPQITADTGMDALVHAIEGYTCQWANDFSDGLCLKAAQLVFEYLPRAYRGGASDPEARAKMHCAASIAGLGFGNAMAALAHALGHSAGAVLGLPHGRAVGLFLPYTIEFTAYAEIPARYDDLCRALGLPGASPGEAVSALATAIRRLARGIDQPTTLQEAGISAQALATRLPKLVDHALSDGCLVMGRRCPTAEEVEKLFSYAATGQAINF